MKRICSILLILAILDAAACSCGPKGTIQEGFSKYTAIFKAEIIRGEIAQGDPDNNKGLPYMTFHAIVEKSWKGNLTSEIVISTPPQGLCGYTFHLGAKYLVYGTIREGKIFTDICTHTKPALSTLGEEALLDQLEQQMPNKAATVRPTRNEILKEQRVFGGLVARSGRRSARNMNPDVLYHYCGNSSLLAIVQTKSLLMTSVTSANDFQEAQRVRPLIVERLNVATGSALKAWQDLLDNFDRNNHIPFVACFSEQKDQLSQWRGYADDGKGVSIGFNMVNFGIGVRLPTASLDKSQTIGLQNVLYNEDDQKAIINKLLDDYIARVTKTPEQLMDASIQTMSQIWQFSLISKNPGFAEEEEWRIIHTPMFGSAGNAPIKPLNAVGERQSRIVKGQITTSIPLALKWKSGRGPIREVILGPKNTTHLFDLMHLFHENGLTDVTVEHSNISYR